MTTEKKKTTICDRSIVRKKSLPGKSYCVFQSLAGVFYQSGKLRTRIAKPFLALKKTKTTDKLEGSVVGYRTTLCYTFELSEHVLNLNSLKKISFSGFEEPGGRKG